MASEKKDLEHRE